MSTVYIHVGTPKTGTSAIQVFCSKNRKLLKEKGVCYPNLGFDFPGISSNRNGHCLNAYIFDENHKRLRDQEREVADQALEKLTGMLDNFPVFVLSDEQIWNNKDITTERLLHYKEKLAEAGADMKIIVYLRRQDLLIQSYWAQQVKEYMNTCFSDYIVSKKAKYFKLDYDKRLEEMAAAVGRENIIVRVYEKQQYYGGNIISDFLHLFDLEMTDEFKQSDHVVNASLEGACLEAKRLLNANPRFTTKLNFVVPMLTTIQQEKVGEGGYSTGRYFSEEKHQAFLEKYREGNEKVARDYLGREDGVLFKDEIVTEGTGEAETYTTEEMVDILGKVIVMQRDKILQKNEEIAELKKQGTGVKHMIKKAAKWVLRRE